MNMSEIVSGTAVNGPEMGETRELQPMGYTAHSEKAENKSLIEEQPVATGQAGGELGKDEFLRMLITEMQNQDPLDPVDNKEMIAQLAQFSALEQMQNLNTQFEEYRQDVNLLMGLMLKGQEIDAKLADGTMVVGKIDRVFFRDGALSILVGENEYPVSNIVHITAPEDEAPSSIGPDKPYVVEEA